MVDQATTDSEWEQRDIDQRIKRLEAFVGALSEAGMDRFVESGIFQIDPIAIRLSKDGQQLLARDSGDSISESPNANVIQWMMDRFDGTLLTEIFGGYTTPGLNIAQLILRAMSDNLDFGVLTMGVWGQTNQIWNPYLRLSNILTSNNPPFVVGTIDIDGGTDVQWLALRRTDADNFTLMVRSGAALKQVLLTGDVSGAMKVSGSGYEVYPSAAAGIDPANSGVAWTNGAYSQVVASTAEAVYITHLICTYQNTNVGPVESEIDIATGGAGSETVVSTVAVTQDDLANTSGPITITLPHAIAVAGSTRIAVRSRNSSTTIEPTNVKLIYVDQDSLVAL